MTAYIKRGLPVVQGLGRRAIPVGLCITASLATACGSPGGGSAAPSTVLQTVTATASPSGSPSATASRAAPAGPTPTAPHGIEGFDFANAKWFDAWDGRAIEL